MNNPLGVSPSKGNQGTTRGKEKIFWPRWESNIHIFNMVWPWFSCGTVYVCPQFPYCGNDTIFWIFPIVPCHAFCMSVTLANWQRFGFQFPIWGHHHLHIVGLWISVDQLNTSQLATPCWRDPTRSKQLSTVAIWLSVWTVSCRCPVKVSTWYQPCIIIYPFQFWGRNFPVKVIIGSGPPRRRSKNKWLEPGNITTPPSTLPF